jgi:hypothetical protein
MSEPADDKLILPPLVDAADPPPAGRRVPWVPLAFAAAIIVSFAAALAVAPLVLPLLPWGTARPAPQTPPPATDAGLSGRIAAIETAEAQNRQSAATAASGVQRVEQRIAALEARPVADFGPIQQQLTALTKSVADLATRLAAVERDVHAEQGNDPGSVGLVLTLLQIREALEVARPFAAEYTTLVALARTRPEIAAAAVTLAEPAMTGVASRTALTERLRQLAPRIATASAPADDQGWRGQLEAELRSLVTWRRIDGAGQSPAETAVNTAQRALAAGDLAGAVEALGALTGPNAEAAKPWLEMARRRLAVETTLRQLETLATAQLGGGNAAR